MDEKTIIELLQAISDIGKPSNQATDDTEIAEKIGWDRQITQDRLDILAGMGYVSITKLFGPSYLVFLTPYGREVLRALP